MPWKEVEPVYDPSVRYLCQRRYSGHPRGCPNYGKKAGCPPKAPLFYDVLDAQRPIYAIWNDFALGEHIARMREKHPSWSERQLACCLYWQPRARLYLRRHVHYFLLSGEGKMRVLWCPEAAGINVTATMRRAGVELEWPPRKIAYQVVLVGFPVSPISVHSVTSVAEEL